MKISSNKFRKGQMAKKGPGDGMPPMKDGIGISTGMEMASPGYGNKLMRRMEMAMGDEDMSQDKKPIAKKKVMPKKPTKKP